MVGIEMHVRRTPPDLDVVDHLVGIGVDDDDVVGLLVANEDQAGIFGHSRIDREHAEDRESETARCRTSRPFRDMQDSNLKSGLQAKSIIDTSADDTFVKLDRDVGNNCWSVCIGDGAICGA